jgi:serine palmitoyltransferase
LFCQQFYLYLDEAHSIGALGPHGRGVCDYFSLDPRRVDVLMGTFTKSFGAAGGYVAGSKAIIDRLRTRGTSGPYAEAMAPAVLTQVLASMASIMGVEGVAPSSSFLSSSSSSLSSSLSSLSDVASSKALTASNQPGPAPVNLLPNWVSLPRALADGSEGHTRLRRLAFNARYLHAGLDALGFLTSGALDSPIVPLLIYHPGKLCLFHRMMKQRRTPIVVVVVAYPATPLASGRVRFCVSASHTKEDVDVVLRACDEVGDVLDLKHGRNGVMGRIGEMGGGGERWGIERVVRGAQELVGKSAH